MGLTQGQARRHREKWVDLRHTAEMQQDSSKSIYFLEEKKRDGDKGDIEVATFDDSESV